MATTIGTPGVVFPDSQTQSVATPGAAVVRTYTSPATWTKPLDLKYIQVTLIGAGGVGGAGTPPSIPGGSGGGGGGGGGIAQCTIPAPSLLPSYPVGVGPGIPTSMGVIGIATKGDDGSPAPGGGGGAGGVGIISNAGAINMYGIAGTPSFGATTGGPGGTSNLFTGFPGDGGPLNSDGSAGTGFGAGGGGAGGNFNSPGGAGSPGYVIVEEYY